MTTLVSRNSVFNDFLRELTAPTFFVRNVPATDVRSARGFAMDVQEQGDAYLVQAELPGVGKEAMDIAIEGAVVTIKAQVQGASAAAHVAVEAEAAAEANPAHSAPATPAAKVLRSERYYGSVSRSFQLPVEIDADKAQARYEDGVLHLTLPKLAQNGARKLAVN